jgi:F420-non-reducing hydrogenase small subunit
MADKIKMGLIQLCGCSGCHISLLDLHEKLLDVLPNLEIVYAPIIADAKEIPDGIDVFLIEGGAKNEHDKHLMEEIRAKSKTVVAWGTCAAFGGIPGLGNLYKLDDLKKTVYTTDSTDETAGTIPSENVPELLEVLKPVSDVIDVDIVLPGCPPTPAMIANAILALLGVEELNVPTKIVCDECKRTKENVPPKTLKRTFEGAPDPEKCLYEQGYTCMGMGTKAGCGAQCPSAGVPCRGCFGKTDAVLDQGAALANAYASTGDAVLKMKDKVATFNRFTLAASSLNKKVQ